MNCFPCFSSQKSRNSPSKHEANEQNEEEFKPPVAMTKRTEEKETKRTEEKETEQTAVKTFNFRELATATKNFRQECLLGEGGFGRVYKGTLQSSGQLVAVKQLDKHGVQGAKEFQAEVLSLAKLQHPNLVNLIGYCADGDQRLLVHEYISGGSLQDHLYEQKANKKLINWQTRMKIAYGAAQGLDYLHDKVNPPVLYRDLKASNILLDDEFFPKLCDFGMHNLAPGAGDSFLSSHVMDTYGYSAPEYTRGDEVTVKSDVYSFGVVMLELITGRRAVDTTKPNDEQNLVAWAQPIFRDPKRYPDMADPLLKKNFSEKGLNQAVAITSMCLQEEPTARPLVSDVMVALSFLSTSADEGVPMAVPATSFRDKSMSIALSRHGSCSVVPFSALSKEEEAKSDDSSDSEDDEDEKSRSEKKQGKGTTAKDSDDESDSDSEKGQEEKHSKLEKPRSSSSSCGSERRRSIDEKNATGQSLKMESSYSSEDENNERISRKSSSKSNSESTSYREHDDSPKNTSRQNNSDDDEEDEEENHETRLEHIQSSKSEVQSVYSDDDDDDGGEESGRSSLHQNEPEEDEEE